ncbi:MAG: uroporphyrinogen-III synthase [Piscirickettsiaceae bacterium]|nr:MAG: uroporphyrinogen-III synthase [Piscirickettsiaceae bacterium]
MKAPSTNVLVTRPIQQGKQLCSQLINAGFKPISYPTIEIVPIEPNHQLTKTFKRLADFQFILFISTNAVIQAQRHQPHWPNNTRYIAIGPKTAQAMANIGLTVDYMAGKPFNSEQLLSQLPKNLKGKSVLIIKGEGGRDFLTKQLQHMAMAVEMLDVYKRCVPTDIPIIPAGIKIQFVTITSQLALENLAKMQAERFKTMQQDSVFVVLSRRIEIYAKKIGCQFTLVAQSATDTELVKAIDKATH